MERREREKREGEGERTHISAFAVSFLGFHAAINQPKGMLQSKRKRKKKLVQHTLGPVNRKQGGEGED